MAIGCIIAVKQPAYLYDVYDIVGDRRGGGIRLSKTPAPPSR